MNISRGILFIYGLVIYLVEQVLGDRDICDVSPGYYTYCDEGYHCCDNGERCCANGLSPGTVVGIIFGVLFVIGICLLCSIVIAKKKKLRPNQLVRPSSQYNQHSVNVSTVSHNNPNIYPGYNTNCPGQTYPWGQPYYPQNTSPPYDQFSTTTPKPPPYTEQDTAPPPAYKYEP